MVIVLVIVMFMVMVMAVYVESLGIVKFKSVCDSPMLVTLKPCEDW